MEPEDTDLATDRAALIQRLMDDTTRCRASRAWHGRAPLEALIREAQRQVWAEIACLPVVSTTRNDDQGTGWFQGVEDMKDLIDAYGAAHGFSLIPE